MSTSARASIGTSRVKRIRRIRIFIMTAFVVAAPAELPPEPEKSLPQIVTTPVVLASPVPEKIKTVDAVITVENISPAPANAIDVSAPVVVASAPSAPGAVHGDGSSPEPGLDATTQKAQVDIKADPNYRTNPQPLYPTEARRRREQGLVLLTVKVTREGRAAEVKLKKTSGYSLLDDAAMKAVRHWEFVPARAGSLALESEVEVPVQFKLQ